MDRDADTPASSAASVVAFTPSRRDTVVGTAAALFTVAIWAAWPVVTRYGVTTALDPMAISVLRYVPAAIVLAPLLWRLGLIPKDVPWRVLIPLAGGGLPFFLLSAMAFRTAPVANSGTVLSGTIPLAVVLISFVLFNVRVARVRLAGFALIAAAVVITFAYALATGGGGMLQGNLLFVAAGLAWALYTLSFPFSGLTGLQSAAVLAFWSALACLPFGLPGVIAAFQQAQYAEIGVQVFQQAFMSSILSFLSFNLAITRIGALRAATLVALTPLVSATAAYFVLGEMPDWPIMLALLVNAAGIALASRMAHVKT